MQLILADATKVWVTQASYYAFADAGICYSFDVKVNRLDDHGIAVLTGGNASTLRVSLYPHHGDVVLHCKEKDDGINLLKNLFNQFKDKIRIGLEISSGHKDDNLSELKFCLPPKEGMAINADGRCSRTGEPFMDNFYHLNLQNTFLLNVKVIAHITCDGVVAPIFFLPDESRKNILEDGFKKPGESSHELPRPGPSHGNTGFRNVQANHESDSDDDE